MNDRNQALATIRDELHRLQPEYELVLDPKIPVEKFTRVAMTAIQRNPDLLDCSKRSLFLAVQACAQDSLLPDGKEAVLLPFKNNVAYIPMIAGLRRKLREAADVADLSVELVHEGDSFSYVLGDAPHIGHVPDLSGGHERPITHVYSIVRFKDGSISRNVMTWGEVMMIRDRYARSRSGPWFDKASIGEMAKKTCLKRHIKLLPMTAEIERVMERDNQLYDLSPQEAPLPQVPKRTVVAALDAFASDELPADAFGNVTSWEETRDAGSITFNKADEYINYVSGMISGADTMEGIALVRRFWANTAEQREVLKLSPHDIKVLATHIKFLNVPEKEE